MQRRVFILSLVGVVCPATGCVDYPSPSSDPEDASVSEPDAGIVTDTDTDADTYTDIDTETDTVRYICPPSVPDDDPDDDFYPSCENALDDHVPCHYENDLICICGEAGSDSGLVWQCGKCPSEPPGYGRTCYVTSLECRYDDRICTCEREITSRFWNCYQCPDNIPDTDLGDGGSPDCVVTYPSHCHYYEDNVSCTICGGASSEDDIVWECTTCPTSIPDDGTSCEWKNLECEYDSAACVCESDEYNIRSEWKCKSISN